MITVMTIIIVKWIEVVASPCLQTRSVQSIFFLVWGLEISIVDWFNNYRLGLNERQMLIFITTELCNAVFQIDKDKDGFVSLDEFLRASDGDEFEKDEGWKSVEEEPPYTDEDLAEFEKQLAEEEAKRGEAEKHAADTAKNLAGGVVQVGNLLPHGRFFCGP